MTDDDRIPGLTGLARGRTPANDLWPGISARLRPRQRRPWLPLAAAASLAAITLAVLVRTPAPAPALVALPGLPLASDSRAIVAANLDIADDAERQLRDALRRTPASDTLKRLLDSTRQRQTDLRRLIAARA